MKQKWLVISNCQTFGLSNSLSILCPEVEIDACDILNFQSNENEWSSKISNYDQLIINPQFKRIGNVDFSTMQNVTWVPGFYFRGFHPDLCIVLCEESEVAGPLGVYHSLIVFTAFKCGITEAKVRHFFNTEVYRRLGYFALWTSEKKGLFNLFESNGFDIRNKFVKWMREGGFMHSVNHPRINALHSIARMVANKLGATVVDSEIVPHDSMMDNAIFPIYPEFAHYYGVGTGSYYFKIPKAYKILSLDEFISESYRVYQTFRNEELYVLNPHFDSAASLMEELS